MVFKSFLTREKAVPLEKKERPKKLKKEIIKRPYGDAEGYEYYYGGGGRLIKKIKKDKHRKREWSWEYKYEGSRLRQEIQRDEDKKIWVIYNFKYDKKGKLLEKISHRPSSPAGEFQNTWRYLYDRKGRLIKETVEDAQGEVWQTYEFEYHKGKLATKKKLNEAAEVTEKEEYTKYDKASRLLEKVVYPEKTKGSKISFWIHQFVRDEQGNLIEEIIKDSEGHPLLRTKHELKYE